MTMTIDRRTLLRAGGAGLLALGAPRLAMAETGRVLRVNTLASAAAINVPMQTALRSILGTMPGFAAPEVQPTQKIPQIAQAVIAGSSDIGDADVASTLAAAEAGADLKIIGLSYNNTDQVIVVNGDKTKSLEDIAKRGGTIAVNSVGDFMYVMLLGVLKKRGIKPSSINFIEMGSSGDRTRALIAGRVDAAPMHIEQQAELAKMGNFPVLVYPNKEYDNWFSAVVIATGAWLKEDKNKEAAVAVLKSVLMAFRKTDSDYEWYKQQVRKYASSKKLRTADDGFLKPVWTTLTSEIKAFPPDMGPMTVDEFAKIIPVYKEAGALKGTLDLNKVIDRTYLEQAVKELS